MKNLKKSIALVCALLLLLTLAPAAFAELNGAAPDAEYLNPETDGRAEIYDVAGLFSEEERNQLLEQMQGCTDWFDAFIVTDDRAADEITEDPAFQNLCSGYHLALVFGKERQDMRVQWAFSSGENTENDVIVPDEVAAMFGTAKSEYLNGDTAFEAANAFMGSILSALQGNGTAPAGDLKDDDYYQFRTLEELREILAMDIDTEDGIFVTGLEARDYTLEEDLTIPAGKKVFFNEGTVTVVPGVTVTVEEDAGLFFYGMDVKGTVINNGDLVQCEQRNGGDQLPIRIEGQIINRDWFSFYEISEGMENIQNEDEGRLFSSVEGKRVSPDGSSSSPAPVSTPKPSQKPSGSTGDTKKNSSDNRNTGLFALWIAIIAAASLAKNRKRTKTAGRREARPRNAGTASRRTQVKGPAASGSRPGGSAGRRSSTYRPEVYSPEVYNPEEYSYDPSDYSDTDYINHDNQRRMKQLDDWLKSGLIDKEEYRKLKELYSGK